MAKIKRKKKQTIPSIKDDTEQLENSHTYLVEMKNGKTTLENILEFAYKVKDTLTMTNNPTGMSLLKKNKSLCLQKEFIMYAHSNFIHNSLKLEIKQIVIDR